MCRFEVNQANTYTPEILGWTSKDCRKEKKKKIKKSWGGKYDGRQRVAHLDNYANGHKTMSVKLQDTKGRSIHGNELTWFEMQQIIKFAQRSCLS